MRSNVFNAPTVEMTAPSIRPATMDDIMDLEKDLHSIKTLNGYTKQEHAVTVKKLAQAEAKLNETMEKLKAVEGRLEYLEHQLRVSGDAKKLVCSVTPQKCHL